MLRPNQGPLLVAAQVSTLVYPTCTQPSRRTLTVRRFPVESFLRIRPIVTLIGPILCVKIEQSLLLPPERRKHMTPRFPVTASALLSVLAVSPWSPFFIGFTASWVSWTLPMPVPLRVSSFTSFPHLLFLLFYLSSTIVQRCIVKYG